MAQSGVMALRQNDPLAARKAFEQIVAAGRASPQLWLLLAQACDVLDDRAAANVALDHVLAADARNLYALIMKGDIQMRNGDDRAAASWYELVSRVASEAGTLPNDLAERVRRAMAARDAAANRFQNHLYAQLRLAEVDPARVHARFTEALEILSGVKAPYYQEPTSFFYPRLPHIQFYEREAFPWLEEMEAAVPAMRAEIEAVLAEDRGLTPYIERPENRPMEAHSLLDDARWSAFHLWRDGALVEDNARRCPRTIEALASAPIPRIRNRSPMAMFSILRPGTHIPPHHGMLNTRLICHIPLIVPPKCRLRVGNETRTVEEGRALIFDDSIEHEAWNDSDQSRAILLFEIWRPELSLDERDALTAMYEAITTYPSAATPEPQSAS